MREKPSLSIDPTQVQELLQVMPHPGQLSGVRLNWKNLQVANYRMPLYEAPEHTFSKHVISVNLEATAKVERVIDRKLERSCFAPGEVFWINPAGMQRTIRTLTPAQVFHLYIAPEFVAGFAHEWINPDHLEILPSFRPQDALFRHLGLLLHSAVINPTVVDALYADAAATMLAVHLLRHYSNVSLVLPEVLGRQSKLQVVIEFIHAHLDEELCIDTLAQLVQLSPYHFIRLFKHSMGVTPHRYIVQQRLERAKQLLKTTNLAIAEIAYLTGFCHQSRFSTVFRQYVRVSPKVYREQQ